MDIANNTLIASLKRVRKTDDGKEEWIAEIPFPSVNYAFIKQIERSRKGLKFDGVKVEDGRLVLIFVRKVKQI